MAARTTPDYFEHRKRLRERFVNAGPRGLTDYELLELLLTYAIPRQDIKPVAKSLLRRFTTVGGVLSAGKHDLESVRGLGPQSALLIRLVKELFCVYVEERIVTSDVLSSPDAVVEFAKVKLGRAAHEAFMVVYLNVKNHVISHEIINEGTVDHAVVYPRRVVESALANHAASLILVHNHPSGDPTPSPEDKFLTKSIIEAARTMEIRVVDHVIVGRGAHFSFHENHLLPN
jgi:DNA repair protein RadC